MTLQRSRVLVGRSNHIVNLNCPVYVGIMMCVRGDNVRRLISNAQDFRANSNVYLFSVHDCHINNVQKALT